jgi:BlaI family transcriptional regulator, penicillinase repressor
MEKQPRISEAEWDVMKVIWKNEPCSAQTVIDALAGPNEWGAATIKTLLNRLLGKGALQHEKIGKAYVYRAAFTEAESRALVTDSFLARVFDGSLSPLLAHFVSTRKLKPKDIAELEAILKSKSKRE